MLRYLNAGESHGKSLLAVLEGVPAGLPLTPDLVNQDLARRQKGYGRGGRMRHADLVGAIKYAHRDIRNVLEKASARETAIRVAVGGVAKALLAQFSMRVLSYTTEIGGVVARRCEDPLVAFEQAETSDVRSPDPDAGARM